MSDPCFAFPPLAVAHPPSRSSAPPTSNVIPVIQNAVRSNHLGLALSLLRENPTLILPDDVADQLSGRLRLRGVTDTHLENTPFTLPSLSPNPPSPGTVTHLLALGRVEDAIVTAMLTKEGRGVLGVIERLAINGKVRKCEYVVDQFLPALGVQVTGDMVAVVVDAWGKVGRLSSAEHVVDNWMRTGEGCEEERQFVWERLVHACVRCRQMDRAETVLGKMIHWGVGRTQRVWERLLAGAAREGRQNRCWEILDRMREDGVTCGSVDIYNACIWGCARGGRVREAVGFYDRMIREDIRPDLETFNGLLFCYARAGEVERAFALLEDMWEEAGVRPSVASHNWVVKACAKAGQPERAFAVAKKMRRQGMPLTVVTRNNLVEACCNAGRLERAFTIVKSMVLEHNISPNTYTYNTLIRACGRWGQLDSALNLLRSMREAGVAPTVITYSIAVDACAKTGGQVALTKAMELVDEMRVLGLEPNVVTYNSLIHACARAQNVGQAFKIFGKMQEEKIAPDNVTLCSLVDACGRAGRIRLAFRAMRSLPKKFKSIRGSNLPGYNALLHGCCKANDIEGIHMVIEDMKKLNLRPNMVTFSTLISAHAAAGDIKEALKTLSDMKQAGLKPNVRTFTSIIAAYGAQGNVGSAMEIFDEARDASGEPDEELYTSGIVAAIGGGRVEMAVKLSKEMTRAGYSVPKVLNGWMRRVGDGERTGKELRNVLMAMQALGIKPKQSALESLLETYMKEGNVNECFGMLTEMEKLGRRPNIRMYRKVLQCCGSYGNENDIEMGVELFRRVRNGHRESKFDRLRSTEWVQLYKEVIRIAKDEDKQEFVDRMRDDCGLRATIQVVQSVCPPAERGHGTTMDGSRE